MGFNQITRLTQFAVVLILFINALKAEQYRSVEATYTRKPFRPSIRLSAPVQPLSGEYISLEFYAAAEEAEKAKESLQNVLQNFTENAEKNLTTSTVQPSGLVYVESDETEELLKKLQDLSDNLMLISTKANTFYYETENFFERIKNETGEMLLKLRKVPSAHYFLSRTVKLHLTNYFAEMESLYVQLSEVLDDGIDYMTTTLGATTRNFADFASVQKYALKSFKPGVWCCKHYMAYIKQVLPDVVKCAAGHELHTSYDIYAATSWTSKYILRQLEFRIERLFSCFAYDNYTLRCRFLQNAETDFEVLFDKVEELRILYDIRMRKGQISKAQLQKYFFDMQAKRHEYEFSSYKGNEDNQLNSVKKNCIPQDFTDELRSDDLRKCFRFSYL